MNSGSHFSTQTLPATPYWEDSSRQLRLLHGDALHHLRTLPSETYDLVFADPPYFLSNGGSSCHGGQRVPVNKGAWDHANSFQEVHQFNMAWLQECRRLLRPHGCIWVTGTSHNIHSVGFGLQSLGYKILNDIAWHKVNPPPNLACRCFTHATETVLWARKAEKAKHVFHYEAMKQENGGKQMQSFWSIQPPRKREKSHGKHPAQKPEALLERILRASSHVGDQVLDPFCGSGTTGVVCARLGRAFTGIDISAEYLTLAQSRLEQRELLPHVWTLNGRRPTPCPYWVSQPETWQNIVWQALWQLGGDAHLQEIYHRVEEHSRTRQVRTWPATVRRTLRQSIAFEALGGGKYRLSS